MGNTLSFVLGMSTGQFNQAVQNSQQKLTRFLGTAAKITGITALSEAMLQSLKQMGNAVGGIADAFERGADLQGLHNRTGQSVQDLFLLQKAFGAVRLSADSVGEMIFHLQKSLSGVSELGEDTHKIFALLGLDMQGLGKESAPKALQSIAKAFKQLNPAQAAEFSEKLFGRGGAGNFLQLERDADSFTRALKDNAEAAAQMARNAYAFNRIEIDLARLKNKSQNLFAGIAEGIAPAVESIVTQLNRIDLSKIGSEIGTILGGLAGALKQGNLSEAIALSIKTGFEIGLATFPALFAKLGDILLHAFEEPLLYLSAGMEYTLQKFQAQMTSNKLMRGLSVLSGPLAMWLTNGTGGQWTGMGQSFSEILARQKKEGLQFNLGTGNFGLDDISKSANGALKEAFQKSGGVWDNFIASMQKYSKSIHGLSDPLGIGASGSTGIGSGINTGKISGFEGTVFEKLGARLGGSNAPSLLSDHARQTAMNTAKIAAGIQTIVNHLTSGPGATNGLNVNM